MKVKYFFAVVAVVCCCRRRRRRRRRVFNSAHASRERFLEMLQPK